MKYSIMFLLIPFVLISQDIIDPEPILTPDLNNYSVLEKEKSEFVLGWNWGSIGKKLDDALYLNFS